jgi:hypothetical protein
VPELAPVGPDPFGPDRWEQVDSALPHAGEAVRLSRLLAAARETDPDLPPLVALRVLHAVGSAVATARSQGDEAVLLALDDGTVLADAEYGGADLLVGVAGVGVLSDADERREDVA